METLLPSKTQCLTPGHSAQSQRTSVKLTQALLGAQGRRMSGWDRPVLPQGLTGDSNGEPPG